MSIRASSPRKFFCPSPVDCSRTGLPAGTTVYPVLHINNEGEREFVFNCPNGQAVMSSSWNGVAFVRSKSEEAK